MRLQRLGYRLWRAWIVAFVSVPFGLALVYSRRDLWFISFWDSLDPVDAWPWGRLALTLSLSTVAFPFVVGWFRDRVEFNTLQLLVAWALVVPSVGALLAYPGPEAFGSQSDDGALLAITLLIGGQAFALWRVVLAIEEYENRDAAT